MTIQVQDGFAALTEKEKQTLRLIVRGHDAKSIARSLGLSVHTINERLRDARRKMAVSSSREAARLLLAAEGDDTGRLGPQLCADDRIGEDARRAHSDREAAPTRGVRPANRRRWILIGGTVMTLFLGLLALAASLQTPTDEPPKAEVVDAARSWLVLVDQGRWNDSYEKTGEAFRKLNTAQVWARASERVRVPLGAMISRTFASEQYLPAPPDGYEVVKFRTRFANKPEAVETVTLTHERDGWRVVGVTVG